MIWEGLPIPRTWGIAPFSTQHRFHKGFSITKADLVDAGIPVVNYGQVHSKENTSVRLSRALLRYLPENFDLACTPPLAEGDLVFADTSEDLTGVGAFVRYTAGSSNTVFPGSHILVASPEQQLRHPYFAYLYLSDAWRNQIRRLAMGVKVYSVTQSLLKECSVLLPPTEAQDRIVRFLDEETAKIDHLIEKYERLLDLVAVQAETRWHQLFAGLSTCPERPLKRVLQKVTRPAFAGEGVITAFRDGQVTLRANRREEGFTFSDTEDGYQGIEPGDLVYHGLDGFAGAVGVSDSHGNGSPVYHVCRPLDEQDNLHFLASYLRFLGLSGFLATQAPNVRQRSVDFRNWETFSRIPIRVPSRREQDEIVTRLEEFKTSRETTEELTQKAIALLRERRSALITAAVTGQIEM
ncbi:restriction endonuclease subunit S [Actinomyces faecalis]|uniref:restriction endonuclease subunit S n=1 Tax=Actinomyces faecalis TaxID=2722820 RepID=UPI001555B4FA|nr:restriction endonuclease subunit S [Actinomyces faecalis]